MRGDVCEERTGGRDGGAASTDLMHGACLQGRWMVLAFLCSWEWALHEQLDVERHVAREEDGVHCQGAARLRWGSPQKMADAVGLCTQSSTSPRAIARFTLYKCYHTNHTHQP